MERSGERERSLLFHHTTKGMDEKMRRKITEWLSIQRVKDPGKMVLGVIVLFNVALLLVAALVISALSVDGTERMGFVEAAFCTVMMILDAGCIQYVVADIGQSGVLIVVACLAVVILGMITFTGSLIGYVTNYISNFIENANEGKHKVRISNHVVILNWNTRASEILNDFLFSEKKQKIMVLVSSRKEEVRREIEERISDTVSRQNRLVEQRYQHLPFFARAMAIRRHRFRRNLTVVVREGDVFSTKQLQDISLERARSIIILGNDINNTVCRYEHRERVEASSRGNSQTIKTLMQVADITAAESSNDDQKIIVEITDDWTWELVQKIIRSKQVDGKCDIVPVRVNQVLGQILSQFCLMPELNSTYEELFSNRGAEFYSVPQQVQDFRVYARRYLANHRKAIPLTTMEHGGRSYCYYVADCDEDLARTTPDPVTSDFTVALDHDYWMEHKSIVILGHNSKCRDIMQGFRSFCAEWDREGEPIVDILVIDDRKSLERLDDYREYPFVTKTVAADVFDEKLVCEAIETFVAAHDHDTSILILSDDSVLNEDIDANALSSLIYVQEIIDRKMCEPGFDPGSIDVIVEIIDPKHHDIVNKYSVNNVVISNRYISKMIAQIGEVDALFDFYTDILSYDEDGGDSKEIYIKKVGQYFKEVPGPCTAEQLIRAVFEASVDEALPEDRQEPAFVLGYVRPNGKRVLFGGDQSQIRVRLQPEDKLILFSSH